MADKFKNCNITKVEETEYQKLDGPDPWKVLRVSFDHPDVKNIEFSMFVDPNKPETWPYAGVPVEHVDYTVRTKGEWENYTIKKITYRKKQDPAPQEPTIPPAPPARTNLPSSKTIGEELFTKSVGVCVSYVKDIIIAQIQTGRVVEISEAVETMAIQGVLLYRDINKHLARG